MRKYTVKKLKLIVDNTTNKILEYQCKQTIILLTKKSKKLMQNLLNHNKLPATIEILTGYDFNNNEEKTNKTWEQLTDSEKQDIASEWIKDHIYCNVNQVMELLSQNYDHCDYDEYISIAEYQDFEEVSADHINDLTIDELIELISEYDLESDVDHAELFKTKYLNDLIENTSNTSLNTFQTWHQLEITFLHDLNKPFDKYENKDIEKDLLTFFKDNYGSFSFDDLDTCITELGINFDGYLKAYQSDLASLIIDNIDLDQYGNDNNLYPEYQQAYEFWSVSDHFVSMLQNSEQCSNDILGLSVWARYCTGQSICLDHQVQLAAFKVLSDCSYECY